MNPVIELSGVGKRYTKYEDAPAIINATRRVFTRSKRSQLWAVRGVDLDVPAGECLGVIGRNGSGKSTLLQLLCGVTGPTEGRVRVVGRIAPLISVGVGFHPELTGRENVYVNATILGLTRREIDKRFDAIVDFAGIESFIDTPVKFYSSGMYVRLGFSVAIQVEPEVLLVDEVLAVGDLAFQMKCYDRMRAVRESGATVVFVTHNLTIVRNLCDRVIVMDGGRKSIDATAGVAIDHFHQLLQEVREPEGSDLGWARHVAGRARLTLEGVYDGDRRTTNVKSVGDTVVRLRIDADQAISAPYVGVAVNASDGTLVYAESNYVAPFPALAAGESTTVDVRLKMTVPTASYTLSTALYERTDDVKQVQLAVVSGTVLHVAGRPLIRGTADLGADFQDSREGK